MFRMVVTNDLAGAVRQFPLIRGRRLRLGRAADNDLVVPWSQFSLHHASVEARADCVWLEDLGSSHGLVVEDRRCDRLRLVPGMEVWIGSHRILVEEIDEADAEVALTAAPVTDPQEMPNVSTTAEAPPRRSTPQAALRWLRTTPSGGRHPRRYLLQAADVLGASGIALLEIRREEARVESLVGWIEPGIAEALALGRSEAPPDVACELFDVENRRYAVARFLANPPIEPWKRDFLALVGRALTRGREASPDPGQAVPMDHEEVDGLPLPAGMVRGPSPRVRQVFERVRRVAPSDLSVLLLGPTGVGKELFARLVHDWSPRRDGPFTVVQAPEIPETLAEAELFGIERGVATDVKARQGLAVRTRGGTLFLDEIGDLSLTIQAKLLRLLQEREVRPVGSHEAVRIDVRIVAATHRDLKRMVSERTFREDLYYRLAEVCVSVPPLAERPEDIPDLALAFLEDCRGDKRVPGFTSGALGLLKSWQWPGNVRELRSAVQEATALARDGEVLDRRFFVKLADSSKSVPAIQDDVAEDRSREAPDRTLQEQWETVELRSIVQALEWSRGNLSHAARSLGVTRQTLRKRMKHYGLDRRQFEPGR